MAVFVHVKWLRAAEIVLLSVELSRELKKDVQRGIGHVSYVSFSSNFANMIVDYKLLLFNATILFKLLV